MRFPLLLLVAAHRTATAPPLQADVHEPEPPVTTDWKRWLGTHLDGLHQKIHHSMLEASRTLGFFLGKAPGAKGHFSFLMDKAEEATVAESLSLMKDLSKVQHEAAVAVENIAHHIEHSPSSFLQEPGQPVDDDELDDQLKAFESAERKGEDEVEKLDENEKKLTQKEKEVMATLEHEHRARMQRKENEKASLLETPQAPDGADAKFEAQFKQMERKVHADLLDMEKPQQGGGSQRGQSMLETHSSAQPKKPKGETYAQLAARADLLQKQMQDQVANLNPDTPDLVGPGIGQQVKEFEDRERSDYDRALAPSSLLEKGQKGATPQSTWQKQMIALGEKTSWAELSQKVKATSASAEDALKDFQRAYPGASSFVEVGSNGATTNQGDATRRALAALEKKTSALWDSNKLELHKFMSETGDAIRELKVPHTTIAEALERARRHASSFLETGSIGAVGDLTAASQLDALKAKQQRVQAQEQDALDQVMSGMHPEDSSLVQEQSSEAQVKKDTAEKNLGSLLEDVHKELSALKGEIMGPSSFVQTGEKPVPSYDDIEARLESLQKGVNDHLSELQAEQARPLQSVLASSFAEIHAEVDKSVAKARARQATLQAARELEASLGVDPSQSKINMASFNLTAAHMKFADWHKHMQEEIKKAEDANRLAQRILGGKLTAGKQRELHEKAARVLDHLFGHERAARVMRGEDAGPADSFIETAPRQPLAEAEQASLDRMGAMNKESLDDSMKEALASLNSFQGKIGAIPQSFGKKFEKEVLSKLRKPLADS